MIKDMLKILFITLIISLTNISNSFSEIIKDIKIFGNERVNNETIKIFGGIKTGDDINTNEINNVLKKLYETNFFQDIKIDFKDSILSITVVENKIVQNLIIQGIKNKDLIKSV